MGRFYISFGLIIVAIILHFVLIYRRFKKEGDNFKLYRKGLLNDLEGWLPYILIGFGVNAINDTPIETYLIDAGLSSALIFLSEVAFSIMISFFALFGFNIYLKLIGWKKTTTKKGQ